MEMRSRYQNLSEMFLKFVAFIRNLHKRVLKRIGLGSKDRQYLKLILFVRGLHLMAIMFSLISNLWRNENSLDHPDLSSLDT